MRTVSIGNVKFANERQLVFIAGPCVIEGEKSCLETAKKLKEIFRKLNCGFVFKASFDKANRTSIDAYRGPGLEEGLRILNRVKTELKLPILTDIHEPCQAEPVSKIADILQIPAFLARQTDLIAAAAKTGKPLNIKKPQFMAPWDMENAVKKAEKCGNKNIILTERGTSFGYGNLVVDMRGLEIMKESGCPVIFDCTHSVQKPGALKGKTGGDACFAPTLARAATAVGIAGIFFETHPKPEKAMSDGSNSIPLPAAEKFVKSLIALDKVAKKL